MRHFTNGNQSDFEPWPEAKTYNNWQAGQRSERSGSCINDRRLNKVRPQKTTRRKKAGHAPTWQRKEGLLYSYIAARLIGRSRKNPPYANKYREKKEGITQHKKTRVRFKFALCAGACASKRKIPAVIARGKPERENESSRGRELPEREGMKAG